MTLSKQFTRSRVVVGIAGIAVVAAAVAGATSDAGGAPTSAALGVSAPKIGEPAPAFIAVDTRGTLHSLEAYRGQWVVLEWLNHECPYTKKHYAPSAGGPGNTQTMQRDYSQKVVWLSVVSSAPGNQGFTSAVKADELTRKKAASPTALIRDTTGTLGRLYDARTTPQYAIIDPQGVLRYAGAIDDKRTSKVKDIAGATNYVRAALDAALAGNAIAVTQTQPYGCNVKY